MKTKHSARFKKTACLVIALIIAMATVPVFAEDDTAGSDVPLSYYFAARHQGTVERISYKTTENGKTVTKDALVYLPYGYDKNDTSTKYNILYLMHGSGSDENTFLSSSFKNITDNMIANGRIAPMIIVTPTINSGSDDYESEFQEFSSELVNDLMPAVEGTYHTYAVDTTASGFTASRSHRAFGGFSMGGMETWNVFIKHLDYFKYFMPMSGDYESVYEDHLETADESAAVVGTAAEASGYTSSDFIIYSASGSADYLCGRLKNQISAMKKKYPSLFTAENTTFYEASGSEHNYHYSFEYMYNALPTFFK